MKPLRIVWNKQALQRVNEIADWYNNQAIERYQPALKSNIRNYATINELICLSNGEYQCRSHQRGMPQGERLLKLNHIAISQMKVLEGNEGWALLQLISSNNLDVWYSVCT